MGVRERYLNAQKDKTSKDGEKKYAGPMEWYKKVKERDELEKNINFDTLQTDLTSVGSRYESASTNWTDADTMSTLYTDMQNIYGRLLDYQTYMGGNAGKRVTDLVNGYGTILDNWDSLAGTYAKYKDADQYNIEMKQLNHLYSMDMDEILKWSNNLDAKVAYVTVDGQQILWQDLYDNKDRAKRVTNPKAKEGLEQFYAFKEEEQKKAEEDKMPFWLKGISLIGGDGTGFGTATNATMDNKRSDTSYREPQDDWTEEENLIFGSYWGENQEDHTRAYEYATKLNNEKARAEKDIEKQKHADWASQNVGTGALTTAGAIIASPLALADFMDDLTDAAAGRPIVEESFLTPFEWSQTVTGANAQALNDWSGVLPENIPVIGGKGVGDLYQVGTSIAQSAVSAYTLGEWGTLISYFGQGAAQGVDDALRRGATDEQALLYGTVLGLAEGVSEKIGVEKWLKADMSKTLKQLLIKQAEAEGLEEGITAVIGNIADNLIMGDMSNFNNLARQYMAQGMSEEEAYAKAGWSTFEDILFDTIAGAFSGGVHMSMSAPILQHKENVKVGRDIRENKSVGDLRDIAAELNNDLYKKYIDLIDSEKINNAKLGKLYRNVSRETTDNFRKESNDVFTRAVVGMLGENPRSIEIADAIRKKIDGEKLTSREKEILNSDEAKSVYDTLVTREKEFGIKIDKSGIVRDDFNPSRTQSFDKAYDNMRKVERVVQETSADEKARRKRVEGLNKGTVTEVTATGNSTKIESIKKDGDSTIVVTSEGEFNVDDMTFSKKDAHLVSYAEIMDQDKANLFLQQYDGKSDVEDYKISFDTAYKYGELGFNADTVLKHKGVLSEAQASAIYTQAVKLNAERKQKAIDAINEKYSGRAFAEGSFNDSIIDYKGTSKDPNKVKWSELTTKQRRAISFAKAFAKVTGVNVHFIKSSVLDGEHKGENGSYDASTNTIEIDVFAGRIDVNSTYDAIISTLSHEVTHWMKEKAPAIYSKMREHIAETLAMEGTSIDKRIQAEMNRLANKHEEYADLSNEELAELAIDELVARSCEDMLTNSKAARELLNQLTPKQQKSLIGKLQETVQKIIDWADELLNEYKSDSEEAKILREHKDRLQELSEMWDEALTEAIKTNQSMKAGGVKLEGDGRVQHASRKYYTAYPLNKKYAKLDKGAKPTKEEWEAVGHAIFADAVRREHAGERMDYDNMVTSANHVFYYTHFADDSIVPQVYRVSKINNGVTRRVNNVIRNTRTNNQNASGQNPRWAYNSGNSRSGHIGAPGNDVSVSEKLQGDNTRRGDGRSEIHLNEHNSGRRDISDRGLSERSDFKLESTVEETPELIAVHNMTAKELLRALSLGGLTMPSIAVLKAKQGYSKFGEISLIFRKETIDPKQHWNNKLYGADAWTPQQVQLKKNAKFDVNKTVAQVREIKALIGKAYTAELFSYSTKEFKEKILAADGSIYHAFAYDIGMQTAYAMRNFAIDKIPTKRGKLNMPVLKSQLDTYFDSEAVWRKYKKWLERVSDSIITSYDSATSEDFFNNMRKQKETTKPFRLSMDGQLVVPATAYEGIDTLRENKGRLSNDADAAVSEVAQDMLAFAKKLGKVKGISVQTVVDTINATFEHRYNTTRIVESFKDSGISITQETAASLQELYKKAVELPTQYFEAKPHRMVEFDEIATAIIPDNTDVEIKDSLTENGIPFTEYKAGDEQARLDALNKVPNVQFSDRMLTDFTEEDAKKYVNKAIREYHTTTMLSKASYLTTTGSMLDFSDGQRYRVKDHREISEILDLPEDAGYSDGMILFMNMGNIRLQEYGVDISVMPNAKQISALRNIIYKIMNDNDEFYLDVSNYRGDNVFSMTYDANTSASKIIADIQNYFNDGTMPEQQSSLRDFYYSDRDSKGRTLTNGQKDYFADSKIRTTDGVLKVMYHGSGAEFTIFDRSKAKSSGYYGSGFYFTESESHAKQYGSNYEVYLNIVNPIQQGTKNISKAQLKKFIQVVADNEDYGLDNYGYGATVDSVTNSVYGKEDFAMLLDINASCIGDMVEAVQLFNEVNGTDYDGIVAPTETVAFYENQIKKVDNENPTADKDIRYSDRNYTYEALVSKSNMSVTKVQSTALNRSEVTAKAIENVKDNGYTNENGNAVIYVDDIKRNIIVPNHSITHGMDRRFKTQAPVLLHIGEVLKNAIRINELNPRSEDIAETYALIGVASDNNVFYTVSFVVNSYTNEVDKIDVLYSSNTKKGSAALLPTFTKKFSATPTDPDISIANLLELVNLHFADLLPEDVLRKFGYDRRPEGKLGASALYSDRTNTSVHDRLGQGEDLKKQNEKLEADIARLKERLKLERQVTKGNTFNAKQLGAVAGHLRNISNSTYDKAALVEELKDIYTYIVETPNLEWEELMVQCQALATKMLDNSKGKKVTNDYFKDVLADIRKARIKLNEGQIQEAKNVYGEKYRDAFMGRIMLTNDGVSLDQQWKEWSSMYPEIFDETISDADQITALSDIYDALREGAETYQKYNDIESVRTLAVEIYNQYWNVSTITTTADKYDKQIKRLNFEHRKAMGELRSDFKEKLKNQETADAIHYGRIINDIRKKKDAEVKAAKEKGTQKLSSYKEAIEKKAKIQSITDKAMVLNKWMLKNSKDEHIPEAMKPAVAHLLKAINFSSERLLSMKGGESKGKPTRADVSLAKALRDVREMVSEARVDGNIIYELYGADIDEDIKKLVESVDVYMSVWGDNEYVLNKMTLDELHYLDKLVGIIKSSVTQMNKFHIANSKNGVAYEGQRTFTYLDSLGQAKLRKDKTVSSVIQALEWGNATPYYAFKRFGESGVIIYEALMEGWDKFSFNVNKIIKYAADTYTEKEVTEWSKEEHNFDIMQLDGTSITVKMTTAQIMSLYCLQKREQAKGHISGGGIRIADFESGKEIISQSDGTALSDRDLKAILGTLTERQLEVADALQKFMNEDCTVWGNEISMARFGYKAFGEENYFPIRSDENVTGEDEAKEKEKTLYRLLNASFTKSTLPNADNRIVVDNIFDVFAQHTSEMAKYNALALPVLDAVRWFNYKERTPKVDGKHNTYSVKASMEKAFGKDAKGYVNTFLQDINGSENVSRDKLSGAFFTNAKIASVAFNARVIALQPTSYLRASALIDAKYLTKGMASKPKFDMAKKYCGIALWKSMGFYDTSIQRGVTELIKHDKSFKDKATEWGMKGAEKADEWTLGHLWNACELETKDKHPELQVGSEEFYQMVGKRLTQIIYATQVVDSTMTRSHMMRSSDKMDKMLTAFGSEPTLSYNMLQDCYFEWKLTERQTGSKSQAFNKHKGKMLRVFAAYTTTNIVASLIETAFEAWRDNDDEEEEFLDYLKMYLENFGSNQGITTKIPYLKDIISGIQGFTSSRTDTQWIQNMTYGVKEVFKLFDGKGSAYKAVYRLSQVFSQMSGIATSNIIREFVSMWNNTFGAIYPSLKIK